MSKEEKRIIKINLNVKPEPVDKDLPPWEYIAAMQKSTSDAIQREIDRAWNEGEIVDDEQERIEIIGKEPNAIIAAIPFKEV